MNFHSEKKPERPLFARKISGIGWTLNPNHPVTWIVMLAVLIIIVYSASMH
ncbi:hypothetical protein [Paenibacillus jilunlii]|uniref:hypothetical protein n=1 Tax=Paenibacillus jilunlii TaxID=682956 RepID=UPI0012FC813A|nr:hypothetical protein [Paenibacillus jilunlii]